MSAILKPDISGNDDMQHMLNLQRAAFFKDMNPAAAARIDRLKRIIKMTEKYGEEIAAAISQDFGNRARAEAYLAELMPVVNAARHNIKHLRRWMKPRKIPISLLFQPGRGVLMPQPLGVVGVVAPWNYAYQLVILPAVGALAAGNRVIAKPSELLPTYSALLKRIVGEFFNENEFAIVTGDAEVGKTFSALPFDHLIFTGSTAVGRIVAQAAGKNLTPVTLELGGKSPVIVDASADLHKAAAKIVWGKLFNGGQTCVAPDYVFVPRQKISAFVDAVRAHASKMFPSIGGNPDYTSVVNQRHYARLQGLLQDAADQGANVVAINPANETFDANQHKMPLTLVLNVHERMQIMRDEIFGPLLPIMPYDRLEQAIDYVNAHDRPLALYWFGENATNRNQVLANTISGGVTINDSLLHAGQEEMPFGGVGPSGMGAYHGECGFRQLSKDKPVFFQSRLSGLSMMYPPYGPRFEKLLSLMRRFG